MRPTLKLSEFGAALRKAREENGYSLQSLARHLKGCSRELIEDWEAGYSCPPKYPLNALFAMSHALRRFEQDLRTGNFEAAPRLVRVPIPLPEASAVDEPPSELPRPATFGEALRRARLQDGLTQDALGELCDVEQTTVSAWEGGSAVPVRENYDKLLDLFPELAGAPDPNPRDIEKPVGPAGMSFERPARVPFDHETVNAVRAVAKLPPLPEPEPETSPMPEPISITVPAIVRWTRAAAALRLDRSQADALSELLQAGSELGLDVGAVGSVLREWPAPEKPAMPAR